METINAKINEIKRILNNQFIPVGVKIIKNNDKSSIDEYFQDINTYKRVDKKFFCYYIRQAAQDEEGFLIKNDNKLDCKNPYFCLGFIEPKYHKLEPSIKPYDTKAILIGSLNKFKTDADSIIFILNARQSMLMIDTLLSLKKNIHVSFNAHMALCVEIVANSIVNQIPILSHLCYGSRFFSEYKDDELAIGIPYDLFDPLCKKLKKVEKMQHLLIKSIKVNKMR